MGGHSICASDVLFDEHPPGPSPLEFSNGIMRQHSLLHLDRACKELAPDVDKHRGNDPMHLRVIQIIDNLNKRQYTIDIVNSKERTMKRNILKQYTLNGILYTVCRPQKAPKHTNRTTRHLGKSDSSVARFTGRYNHA